MTVQRVRIDLAYDGTDFSGWAAQPGRRTVEGELSAALTTLLRAPEPVRLTVAGRTDAGVHARGQVAHADVDASLYAAVPGRSTRSPEDAARTRLAGILPPDIVVRRVSRAPEGFDARFSAVHRRYLYRICDDLGALDPLRRRDTVVVKDRARCRGDGGGGGAPHGAARLRGVLQEARRRDHRANAARLLVGAGVGRNRRWPRWSRTPSATAWFVRWWEPSSRWDRGVPRSTSRGRSSPHGCVTRGSR